MKKNYNGYSIALMAYYRVLLVYIIALLFKNICKIFSVDSPPQSNILKIIVRISTNVQLSQISEWLNVL